MNINSQFFITNYTGNEALNLMEMPATIIDNTDMVDYRRFIEAVSTIYASQNTTGGIPIFWTVRNPTTDLAGNTQYVYTPSDDSTLRTLEPKGAYYFILRDSSYVPLKIPNVGGQLVGFTDKDLLPHITNLDSAMLSMPGQNTITLNPQIDHLQPYETYKYEFKGVQSNWPITFSPLSGLLKPFSGSGSIISLLSFCATTGSCVSDIEYSSIETACPSYLRGSLYATIQLSISPVSYSGIEIYSSQVNIGCKDCLPRLQPKFLGASGPTLSNGTSFYDFETSVDGLDTGKNYIYQFESVEANWPAKFITPISGLIRTDSSSGSVVLKSRILFCPSTGLCPAQDDDVLSYTLPPKFIDYYYTTLACAITPEACDNDPIYSIPLTIFCNDCL